MRKNENKTFKYLQELLPGTTIDREFTIHEPIYLDGKQVKHFIMCDFHFVFNGKTYLVEYQGSQHYKAVRKWGGKRALDIQKARDQWLRGYAKGKGITLIELDGRVLRGKKIRHYLESVLSISSSGQETLTGLVA